MKAVVFGATGRTGRHLLAALAAAGYEVIPYGRRKPDGWTGEAVIGALDDRAQIAQALDGADVVLSALASSRSTSVCLPAAQSVVAVGKPGLRYLTVAGAAVDVPSDAKGLPDRFIGGIFKLLMRKMLAERQAEYDLLADSHLSFTMLRPPMLKDGGGAGDWLFTHDKPATTKIDRADLARAMVAAIADDGLIRRAPFVSAPPVRR
ncbi:NAD(P)-dependent oxidoreductase [Yoonia vestfoldensis]|uniref:NAD(P)-dependent oxidoreductase n=1 Tax=Yoonia vestfoldensis TaxID=245188 RepID=UPI00035CDF68|nr:NAD(P)H-binding protein [Yoonia vestfoldensis]